MFCVWCWMRRMGLVVVYGFRCGSSSIVYGVRVGGWCSS